MKLDNEDQRTFLLELLDVINVPGKSIEVAADVKRAIRAAEVEEAE